MALGHALQKKDQATGKPSGKPDGYVARPSEANEPLLENPRYRKIKDLNSGTRPNEHRFCHATCQVTAPEDKPATRRSAAK